MQKAIIFNWKGTLYNKKGLYPYTRQVLEQLKDYKLGLIAVSYDGIGERLKQIKHTGLNEFFYSMMIDSEKTERQYSLCMEDLSVEPKKTIIVDNGAGIEIGNRFGCHTILLTHNKPISQYKPKITIPSIRHLLPTLSELL